MDQSVLDLAMEPAVNRSLPDAEDRRIIEEELGENIVVVASAGTGKTESLIRRMVAGVVDGSVDVESMVAITFTRMAAGEMRARFAKMLRERAADNERALDALRRMDRCFIGTIHAFCARLLRERPLEAGLRPDFNEVDERDVRLLWRHFWREAVQQLYDGGDKRLDRLEEVGIDISDLYDFFISRSENSDLRLKEGRSDPPDLASAVAQVRSEMEKIWDLLGGTIPRQRDRFLEALDKADHFVRNRRELTLADRAELLRIYERGKKITQRDWDEPAVAKRIQHEILTPLVEEVVRPALKEWRQYVYGIVAPLIDDLVDRFSTYRRTNGLVTFHDLLVSAARVLRDSPEVRTFFQRKYTSYFVDEFQDTDPLQAEIILYLVGDDPDEEDWRKLVPRPGRLSIVGDEKQSIYRFRRADIEVFRTTRRQILESGGRLVRLTASFRSQTEICDWINATFEPLFAEHDNRFQPEYDRLISRREKVDRKAKIRRLVEPELGSHIDPLEYEAERIARYIRAEVDRKGGRTPGQFMILTRKKKGLDVYGKALESIGIPYDMVGGDSIGMSEDVRALVQMLESVRRPLDAVAMLGYLRGPLVGLGDDELYAFRSAGGRFRSNLQPPAVSDSLQPKIDAAWEQLRLAKGDLNALPPALAFERILDRLGLVAFAAAQPGGSARAGNLMRLLSLVRKWESDGLNWSEIVVELQAVIEDRNYQYEQMTLEIGRDDVVRVMNLHQAKGLEADVVFLAHARDKITVQPDQHFSRTGDDEVLSRAVTKKTVNRWTREVLAEPIGFDEDMETEKLFDQAEELRMLYVAATRARDELIVCRHRGKGAGVWKRLYPSLRTVPDLESPEEVEVVPETTAARVRVVDSMRLERLQRWKDLAEPSWHMQTVTGEDPSIAVEDDLPRHGRGADYGTVMHNLIEVAIEGRLPDDLGKFVEARAKSARVGALAEQLHSELRGFLESSLFAELAASEQVYSEVPFAENSTNGTTVITRGKIDLVYRAADGWKIVDFKSHLTETEDEINTLMSRYAGQLAAYKSAWERIAGAPVAEVGIWLTERARYQSIRV